MDGGDAEDERRHLVDLDEVQVSSDGVDDAAREIVLSVEQSERLTEETEFGRSSDGGKEHNKSGDLFDIRTEDYSTAKAGIYTTSRQERGLRKKGRRGV